MTDRPYTDPKTAATNAAWIDGDPLMEAIAAAVWENCRTEHPSSVVDDPRNIAAVAAAVARSHGAYTAAEMAAAEADVAALEAEFPSKAPTTGWCSFGEDDAPGAGCIKPAGHDGAHLVTPGDVDDD